MFAEGMGGLRGCGRMAFSRFSESGLGVLSFSLASGDVGGEGAISKVVFECFLCAHH